MDWPRRLVLGGFCQVAVMAGQRVSPDRWAALLAMALTLSLKYALNSLFFTDANDSKWTWNNSTENNYLSKRNPAQADNIRSQPQRIMERNKIPLLSHFSDPKSCLLILLHALCCSTMPATRLVRPTMQNENNFSEIPRKGTTFGCETCFHPMISQ